MSHLHIVTFDVPYPANYGGVIDVYYKVKALHEIGIKVHLHCYVYGREQAAKLEEFCVSVNYYQRDTHPRFLFDSKPYIVNTRSDKELLDNLLQDNYPILFEGLHTTYLLKDNRLKGRLKLVRAHNVEHKYYWHLCKAETNLFKKLFFAIESFKLKHHEKELQYADQVLAITAHDQAYFRKYGPTTLIPAFHSDVKVPRTEAKGRGVLYHGNLTVSENKKAVLFLLENVFSKISFPVLIAGKEPSQEILKKAARLKHVDIKPNPTQDEMLEYIRDAQVNVLITFQSTGIKLKLLNALMEGRHCVVNNEMIEKTGLASLCSVADTPADMIKEINRLHDTPYTVQQDQERKEVMQALYSNRRSALKILDILNKA